MKKILYIPLCLLAITGLGACNGHEDYDHYVNELKEQPALIDTISTPQGYADYVTSYIQLTDSFAQFDLKMDETQTDEIKQLSATIEQALRARYDAISANADSAVTPATPAAVDSVAGSR